MPLALLAALAASLLTHATALLLPDGDWLPANQEEPSLILHAELQVPAPPAFPSTSKPSAKSTKTTKLGQVTKRGASDASPTASPQSTVTSHDSPETDPGNPLSENPPPAKTPIAMSPPPGGSNEGTLSYRVYKGTQGFEVGRSIHQWAIDKNRYTLISNTETSGLAGLFFPIKIELRSIGEFGPNGFIPSRFLTFKQGNETDENAVFDWQIPTVRLDRDGKTRNLAPGSQDLLSFPFQLAYRVRQLGAEETHFPMHVASGKRYDAFNFTVLGEETIDSRAGQFKTLHLQAKAPNNSADTTDVWLAIEYQWLAIKIRFTDRNGDSFEQVIDALQTQSNSK
jgi:hypothetical protein